MLLTLSIHDLAIIVDTTLELSDGLNVLTGETGAGKSIIIEALSLVLGDRADVELVRRGKDKAEVSAVFHLDPAGPTRARLEALDLLDSDDPTSLVVRRIVAAQGKGRVYINGRPVTVTTLAEVTRGLVDISSQHQHTQLLDPTSHLEILDRFGGLTDMRKAFTAAFSASEARRRATADLRKKIDERQRREAFVRFQLQEIDEVAPLPDEDQTLEAEYQKLAHADRLVSGVEDIMATLSQGQGSIADRLTHANRSIDRLRAYDANLSTLAERLAALRIEAVDIAQDLRAYAGDVESDPRRLDAIASRLEALKRLKKKHGADLEAVIASRDALRAELSAFESLDLDLADAERAEQKALAAATAAAQTLSTARAAAKTQLEARVAAELQSLAMSGAEIRFVLTPRQDLGPDGLESGEIHIQTNRGEGFSPLAKTASGGELARVLLALKRALMHVDPVETCIFDEVDSGTGGAVGDMIGKKLAEIGAERQVLVITHLASIAARGRTHLKVEKLAQDDRTLTHVLRLDDAAREDEIARMLGGLEITRKTREHARELLSRRA